MKNGQDGSKKFKPCHSYANHEEFSVFPITAIFEYLCCFPDALQDPDDQLFLGFNNMKTLTISSGKN
jgi:hypothetical protein